MNELIQIIVNVVLALLPQLLKPTHCCVHLSQRFVSVVDDFQFRLRGRRVSLRRAKIALATVHQTNLLAGIEIVEAVVEIGFTTVILARPSQHLVYRQAVNSMIDDLTVKNGLPIDQTIWIANDRILLILFNILMLRIQLALRTCALKLRRPLAAAEVEVGRVVELLVGAESHRRSKRTLLLEDVSLLLVVEIGQRRTQTCPIQAAVDDLLIPAYALRGLFLANAKCLPPLICQICS